MGHASLYTLLEERFSVRVERADQTIKATVLDPGVSSILGTAPFTPAFLVTRIAYDGRGRAVEYAESLYRGDRYSYELAIQRRHHPRES